MTGRVLDLERIDEPDDAYDVVLVREGLMLAVEPRRAAREIARVLRPGGRLVVAVWGPRARNPWLGLIFDAVSAQLGKTVPPHGRAEPVLARRRGDPAPRPRGRLLLVDHRRGALDAGAGPVVRRVVAHDAGARRASDGGAPGACRRGALAQLDERLRAAVSPYETEAGLEIPGVTLLASCS